MVLDLLGKCVRQANEPPHRHAHAQIVPFNEAGTNVLHFRIAESYYLLCASADGGAVALLTFRLVAEVLH